MNVSVSLPLRALLSFIALGGILVSSVAQAYTPEDPIVQAMVDRGLRFLEKNPPTDRGETVLCAYAHFKVEHDESNPVVKAGIEQAKRFAEELAREHSHKGTYEAAVATLLLCEVGPKRFRSELSKLQRFFQESQKGHGGFGYPEEGLGDISQTQYATLAIWTLDRSGYKMDLSRINKVIQYLHLVQDVNGGWPYKGTVPRTNQLTRQKDVTAGLTFAAGSAMLIGGDALGAWGKSGLDDGPQIVGMPKAVKIYKEDANEARREAAANRVDKGRLLGAVNRGAGWANQNPDPKQGNVYWWYYFCYTLERFESFLELAEGKRANPSPPWYNQIVNELKNLESPSGGWTTKAHTSPQSSTSFAVLFLIRSTKKSLGASVGATTIGGRGFGDDVSKARMVGGKVIVPESKQALTDMLALLEGDGADELDGKAMMEQAELPKDPVQRAAQLDRLERLVRGSQSWQARRVAARVLGTSDELRVVPALIFALSDPDTSVRVYARDGLRFISRKFEGFGMPDKPDNTELFRAQRKWREWYRTMRPGYIFLDD
ncbi:MAG: hypothetical protein AAFX06_03140 [Planctomycetota bacterium]